MKLGNICFCLVLCMASALSALGHISEDTVTSETFVLETRTSVGGRLVHGNGRLSPVADKEDENVWLSVDGAIAEGWSVGTPQFDSTVLADGWHEFVLNEGTGSVRGGSGL